MPLRGKQADEGVLLDLLKLRIDSGDNKLKSHFEKCRRNAIYTSPRIQNELINLCGEVIQENVISEVRKTMAYSILADETADVSGKEQLSIGVRFYDESKKLVKSLETLSVEGNYATRKSAYQLHSAVTKPVFIVSLQTIAKYSAVIEPVVNALQAKSIDMISVGKHIKNIKDILRNDREFPDRISNEILQKARAVAMDLNIEISVPRLAHKQTHRSNPPSDNDNEYWRRSLIIPYIDSLISSLNIRFSQENTPAFALSRLHPLYMTKTSIADLHKNAESFQEFYNLDITGELNLWHNLWVTKALSDDQLKDIEVVDLFKEANIFYPAVRKALIILSTIPCTTATVERSFSTLRRVKTWLRSTMGEERLTGLCLMSVHRNYLKDNSEFIEKIVIDKFSANPRRLLLN
nr:unnamed protein product [Callosobruchus analis]CAI5817467.1 unnamed protein product [Callosobruchus analis]CAI5817899.1 unnamed protein product [Callosobruchus analis]CAI5818669.1 unnamed protein product [Callosobruchus analis]CAI5818681.1 unnamed protein product [Callosobruchus analis]